MTTTTAAIAAELDAMADRIDPHLTDAEFDTLFSRRGLHAFGMAAGKAGAAHELRERAEAIRKAHDL